MRDRVPIEIEMSVDGTFDDKFNRGVRQPGSNIIQSRYVRTQLFRNNLRQ